ncbi:hypothetical protein L6164_028788 [Bauhinia variegata]|uniref:Uncharacterized protein n=1 Tax=Bauhinia variegata TaxID=167791 RepID=A0ACB9L7C9_BAUVA|nr:hypothetical protein L6164_028788 [Bauhinia variegata]
MFQPTIIKSFKLIWKSTCHLCLKLFLWRVAQSSIPIADMLARRSLNVMNALEFDASALCNPGKVCVRRILWDEFPLRDPLPFPNSTEVLSSSI